MKSFLLASAVLSVKAFQSIPADSPLVQWQGRVIKPGDGSVMFDWLGTGPRIPWKGNWLRATFRADTGDAFKWATSMYAQGYYIPESVQWITPINGTADVLIAIGGLEAWSALNSPPQYLGGGAVIVESFSTDGSFGPSPLPQFTRNLEVIGDSITAATNILSHPPCADGGLQCSYAQSYSGLLAANFSANTSTIAVGGKGLVRNCCDNGPKMPDYYLQTLYTDNNATYTFAATGYVPDAVVIALGTNDYSNGGNPTLDAQFSAAYVAFMSNITRYYGDSARLIGRDDLAAKAGNMTFFCMVGPMTTAMENATLSAIQTATGQGLRAVLINASGIYCDGCAGHPGVEGHRAMFHVAQSTIAQTMGW